MVGVCRVVWGVCMAMMLKKDAGVIVSSLQA